MNNLGYKLDCLEYKENALAEQSRAEQSRAEQSRAEQSRAEQDNYVFFSPCGCEVLKITYYIRNG